VLSQVFLGGCFSANSNGPQIRYFVLNGRDERPAARADGFAPEHVICLRAVAIPSYLERPQLVFQRAGGKVAIQSSLRWGEPLAEGIGKVLRRCLERHLPQDLVVLAPWSSPLEPYFLLCPAVDDLAIGDRLVRLRAHCEFWDRNGNNLLGIKRYEGTTARHGNGAEGAVDAVERLAEEFGDALGEDLRRLRAGELDLFLAERGGSMGSGEDAAAIVQKLQSDRPALLSAPLAARKRQIRQTIVLEASSANYVTIDSLETGERVFSKKMKAGRVQNVPYEKAVRVSASRPAGLLVNGKSVSEFNALEAAAPQESAP
jgi:uncharacterized lipoprotein YmbA